MATKGNCMLAILVLVFVFGQTHEEPINDRTFSDGAAIFEIGRNYELQHGKVLNSLRKSYEQDTELEVAKILSQAENREGKIGDFTVEQLFQLNKLALSECQSSRREVRKDICRRVKLPNLKLYCAYCDMELEEFCREAPLDDLLDEALWGHWAPYKTMLSISDEFSQYIRTTGDEDKSDDHNLFGYCRQKGTNVKGIRTTCDKVYGHLEREVLPYKDEDDVIEHVNRKHLEKFSKDITQAMRRCRLILRECEPVSCGLMGCIDLLRSSD